jgi:signal peptidase II
MKTPLRLLLVLALVTLFADQASKYFAVSRLTTALEGRGGVVARLGTFLTARNLDNSPPGEGGVDHVQGRSVEVVPGLWEMRYVENPGAPFGVLASLPAPVRTPVLHVVSLLALGFIVWLALGLERGQRLLRLALALVLGGALGNYLDRALRGYVIDFMDWHWGSGAQLRWPTFNLADVALCAGFACLVLEALRVRPGAQAGLVRAGEAR